MRYIFLAEVGFQYFEALDDALGALLGISEQSWAFLGISWKSGALLCSLGVVLGSLGALRALAWGSLEALLGSFGRS